MWGILEGYSVMSRMEGYHDYCGGSTEHNPHFLKTAHKLVDIPNDMGALGHVFPQDFAEDNEVPILISGSAS